MEFKTSTTYNREIIKKGAWIYWKKNCFGGFLISLGCFVLSLIIMFVFNIKEWFINIFFAISIINLFIFILVYFIFKKQSVGIFEKFDTPVTHWTFSENGIFAESDIGKSEIKWKMFKGLIKSKELWIFIYANNSHSLFPVTDESNEILEFISNSILLNNGKIK